MCYLISISKKLLGVLKLDRHCTKLTLTHEKKGKALSLCVIRLNWKQQEKRRWLNIRRRDVLSLYSSKFSFISITAQSGLCSSTTSKTPLYNIRTMNTFLVETTKKPVWGWRETPKLYRVLNACRNICVNSTGLKKWRKNCVALKISKVITFVAPLCFRLDARSYISR